VFTVVLDVATAVLSTASVREVEIAVQLSPPEGAERLDWISDGDPPPFYRALRAAYSV